MNSCFLQSEKIIPGWNWASSRGHSTLETAGLEIFKGRALENWVSPAVCLISSPAHQKIEKSIGLLLLGMKWLFSPFFFFSFQLIFYWILRKVDLQLPLQRRKVRNKYKICRQGGGGRAGAHSPAPSAGLEQDPCAPRRLSLLSSHQR